MSKELTEQQKKELAMLKANKEMLQRTKQQCKIRKNDESVKLIDGALEEITAKVKMAGGTDEILEEIEYKKPIVNVKLEEENVKTNVEVKERESIKVSPTTSSTPLNFEEINDNIQFDVLPLPSNGEAYPNKKGRIPVSYLTASDENIITSPNLYRDGSILDVLLKRKIMDKDIDPNLLCKGDRDAIILWLRATGYGVDFPITVTDPLTNKKFDTVIDLTTIKPRVFTLKGDENGFFDFVTPIRKDKIKFKFFNRNDEKTMEKLDQIDSINIIKNGIKRNTSDLEEFLMASDNLSNGDRNKIITSIEAIKNWGEKIESTSNNPYNSSVTNGMETAIMEINGNKDREFIRNYVKNMPSLEAFKFRAYITENEPSLDFNITVERPESLGGGSFKTFLEIDYSLFLNIA